MSISQTETFCDDPCELRTLTFDALVAGNVQANVTSMHRISVGAGQGSCIHKWPSFLPSPAQYLEPQPSMRVLTNDELRCYRYDFALSPQSCLPSIGKISRLRNRRCMMEGRRFECSIMVFWFVHPKQSTCTSWPRFPHSFVLLISNITDCFRARLRSCQEMEGYGW